MDRSRASHGGDGLGRQGKDPRAQLRRGRADGDPDALTLRGYVEGDPFNDEPYAHHWFAKRL